MRCVQAWHELHGDRVAWGQTLGPIPPSAIDAYAARHGLDPESRDLLGYAIRIADGERAMREQAARDLDNAGVKNR